ncbi:MAG TPA: hypothetical protein VGV87_19515 [Blastocatellia bacterium]|nr:hypothetical protein [Blastocatellia bacterium]
MNRTAAAKSLIAVFLVMLVTCSSKRAASPAGNGNEDAVHAAQTTDSSPGAGESQDPSKDAQEVNTDDLPAEIIARDGTITKGDPSKVPWSLVSSICFPDCKGAPRDSDDTDLIVLKDGRRKSGAATFLQHSYNASMHVWEGKSVRVSAEADEDIPLTEIRYIKFTDHVFSDLDEALRAKTRAHRLALSGEDKHLSPKVGELTSLKELDIACMEHLEDLPTQIGNLRELEKLIMDNGNGCQMNIALPESIGQLQQLRVLKLYGAMDPFKPEPEFPGRPTRKKSLPQTLANLQNLEELDLGRNGSAIRAIPPQIASLHKLKSLKLDFDDIREIPSFIGSLTNLKELSLIGEHHRLDLPDSVAALEGLKVFMGNNYLKLKDQDGLRKRFPKLVLSFENEYDDDSANEEGPQPPQKEPDNEFDGGGARTADGWRISWRRPGTPFTLELKGKDVTSADDVPRFADNAIKLMSYKADGVLFQVRSVPISEFAKAGEKLSDRAILASHRDWESQSLERVLGEKLNVTSAEQQLSIGQALLWKYDKPKKRGFEQLYLTTVIGGNVVILNGAVERKTSEDTVQKLLLDTMSTLKVAGDR